MLYGKGRRACGMAVALSLLCRVMGFGDVGGCGSPPSALPGISPTGGEIGKTRCVALSPTVKKSETSPRVDLPTCGGDARQGRGG
ncbi:exported hypothetical protein [Agrobacterium deltaense NCPPB 1641]|uniref:Uncharacterized protein n=1 Tax=Agrobacterium deltaense NCPPB 1641 TaxID=1183425 RepID=A0A1S7TRC7_9HYPH|nr:exported hypothetical protein [Agrobacterium deltaense NCPPB 1641]